MYVAYILGNQLFFPFFSLAHPWTHRMGRGLIAANFGLGLGARLPGLTHSPTTFVFFWLWSIRGDFANMHA